MTQPIPTTAPTDMTLSTGYNGNGTKKVSTAYPYIEQYTNLTLATTNNLGFYDASRNISDPIATNKLINAIPFNYDVNGGYAVKVYNASGVEIPSNSPSTPWYFDVASGYLTFYNLLTAFTPTITYWRYNGTFGFGDNVNFSGSNGGSTGTSGTGATGSSGAAGSTGYTGSTGAIGTTGYT
jgi:hypothetical protein